MKILFYSEEVLQYCGLSANYGDFDMNSYIKKEFSEHKKELRIVRDLVLKQMNTNTLQGRQITIKKKSLLKFLSFTISLGYTRIHRLLIAFSIFNRIR